MKLLCLVAVVLVSAHARSDSPPPPNATAEQIATTPVPRSNEDRWVKRHESRVEITKAGGVDLAFLGDSITEAWENTGQAVWDKSFAPLKAANFGFSGDRTEHVLWRLDHGELVGLSPKLIIMMIGTNNLGHPVARQTPQSTAIGVQAILKKLRDKLPRVQILMLGIFPRSEKPDDPLRVKVAETNKRLSTMADGRHIHFLDISQKFLQPDGTMSREMMGDFLHPGPKGYEIWANAIEPKVAQLMHTGG